MNYKTTHFLPISLEDAWAFFTDPANLEKLTPENMKFSITSEMFTDKIYPGMIITYSVSPIWKIALGWMTEITHVMDKKFFVDDQKTGPFKVWHHQHHFEEVDGGVLMTDIIYYKVGFSFLGRIAEVIFVNKSVKRIFDYRKTVLDEMFTQIYHS